MKIARKAQVKQWIDQREDMLLIDVLPPEYFQQQHIPGALNIPFKDNTNFADEVARHVQSKEQLVVVYCANSHCSLSKNAAEKLEEAEFMNVYAYEEGIEGWFGITAPAVA